MSGIVWADVVQFAIMTVAALVIGYLGFQAVGENVLNVPKDWMSPTFGWKLDMDWGTIIPEVNEKIREDGFGLFTIFFMPMFVLFFVTSVIQYRENNDELNKTLIITWILFLIVNGSYYVYYFLGFTESIYENTGIWFSANDVLHVALIGWMLYIQFVLKLSNF